MLQTSSRASSPDFSKIKEIIEKTIGKEFTFNIFKQILYLVPDFYDHEWAKKAQNGV